MVPFVMNSVIGRDVC